MAYSKAVIPGRSAAANPESKNTGLWNMASGFTPAACPGMTADLLDRFPKIEPIGIVRFDQADLPITPPFLYFFLAFYCRGHIVVDFKPHQSVDIVSRGETTRLLSVLIGTPNQIVRDAEIQRTRVLISEEIDVVGHG